MAEMFEESPGNYTVMMDGLSSGGLSKLKAELHVRGWNAANTNKPISRSELLELKTQLINHLPDYDFTKHWIAAIDRKVG